LVPFLNQFRIETRKTRHPAEETSASTGSIQSSPTCQRQDLPLLLSFSPSLFLSFGAPGIRVGTVDQAGLEIEFPQAAIDRRAE
jgi:hypothetical protein